MTPDDLSDVLCFCGRLTGFCICDEPSEPLPVTTPDDLGDESTTAICPTCGEEIDADDVGGGCPDEQSPRLTT